MDELENDVRDAEQRWNSTYLAGDVEEFAKLVDNSFIYLSERGEFGREEYLSNLASGVIAMRNLTTIKSQIRVFGDVAIVTGEVRMEATFHGADISGTDRYTRVWHRQANGLVNAISQHANVVALD